jgi:beta-lactamase regulating signal transducer with metallopeptidase domain
MNPILSVDSIGASFAEFALHMFIQSSILIVILLAADRILRNRVRAVFRYWLWFLVLIKLVLPPSLSSPISLGVLFGDRLEMNMAADAVKKVPTTPPQPTIDAPAAAIYPNTAPNPVNVQPLNPVAPQKQEIKQIASPGKAFIKPQPPESPPSLSFPGGIFLAYLAGVAFMLLFFARRALFVRRLMLRATRASREMYDLLDECRRCAGLEKSVELKICADTASPAVCGLFKPAVLIPHSLMTTLSPDQLRAVLLHELMHIKRGDHWINLAQTVLQIFYFYNPLFWLANARIRRAREQAVDEAVLVLMGGQAPKYPEILLNVAKLAFERPAFSHRLIGVVESKNALASRIKHILNRPVPKTATLGIAGLLVILICGVILLPMVRGRWWSPDYLVKLTADTEHPIKMDTINDRQVLSMQYDSKFAKDEKLFVVAELYQSGKPMRPLGYKFLEGSDKSQVMNLKFTRQFEDKDKTISKCNLKLEYGDQILSIPRFIIRTDYFYPDTYWRHSNNIIFSKLITYFEPLFVVSASASQEHAADYFIWMPGFNNVTQIRQQRWYILIKALPASMIEQLSIDAPFQGSQILDGTCMKKTPELAPHRVVAEQYRKRIKQTAESFLNFLSITETDPLEPPDKLVSRTEPISDDETNNVPPVKATLLPVSPIRSLADYRHNQWVVPSSENVEIETCEFEIRASSDNRRIARFKYNNYPLKGRRFGCRLQKDQIREIGTIANGTYRIALYVNGIRCSNIAELRIDSNADLSREPVLKLVFLPTEEGTPILGMQARGPDPADPDFWYTTTYYPDLFVDGTIRKLETIKYDGVDGVLQANAQTATILDLENCFPAIEPNKRHIIWATAGKYQSAPIVIPAGETAARGTVQ